MEAVALVIINRFNARKWFTGYRTEYGVKIPGLPGDFVLKTASILSNGKRVGKHPNYRLLAEELTKVIRCLPSVCILAARAIGGLLVDFTNNATFIIPKRFAPKWTAHKSPC